MKIKKGRISIFCKRKDDFFTPIIIEAYEKSRDFFDNIFELDANRKVKVHIIHSKFQYLFLAVSWLGLLKSAISIFLIIFLLLRLVNIDLLTSLNIAAISFIIPPLFLLILTLKAYNRIWKKLGGCVIPKMKNPIILLKNLEQEGDTSVGEIISRKETDVNKKIAHLFIHELAHIFSHNRKLPQWIDEGLAMLYTEIFLECNSVKVETLEYLKKPILTPLEMRKKLKNLDSEALAYIYIRGYWTMRYFYENHPDWIKRIIRTGHHPESLKKLSIKKNTEMINYFFSNELKIESTEIEKTLNDLAYNYFKKELETRKN